MVKWVEHLQVQNGQRLDAQEHVVGVVAAPGHSHRPWQQGIVLAVHHPLGVAGGARGVGDGRHRQRIALRPWVQGIRPGHPHPPLVQANHQRCAHIFFGIGGDKQRGLAVVDQIALLRWGQHSVNPHEHRSLGPNAQEGGHDVDVVSQRNRHPITGSHPQLVQRCGNSRHLVGQFCVSQPPACANQRSLVGHCRHRPLQQRAQRQGLAEVDRGDIQHRPTVGGELD